MDKKNPVQLKSIMTLLIVIYQKTLSPFLGQNCKHYPSCSHYGIEALNRHGALKGSILTIARLIRCNPWSYGGYDPVPDKVTLKEPKTFKLSGNYQTKLYK